MNELLLNVALFVCIFKKTHIYFLNTMKQIWWKMILWLRKIGLFLLMAFRTWASKSQKIDQNHKKSSNIFEHSRKYLTRLWFPRCAGCEKTASHSPHCRSNWAHWSAACCRNDLRKEKPSLVNLIDNRLSTKTKRQTY